MVSFNELFEVLRGQINQKYLKKRLKVQLWIQTCEAARLNFSSFLSHLIINELPQGDNWLEKCENTKTADLPWPAARHL